MQSCMFELFQIWKKNVKEECMNVWLNGENGFHQLRWRDVFIVLPQI